ncbi:MAG: FecR domain-containing protein, partial [Dongiaceae bacterium]
MFTRTVHACLGAAVVAIGLLADRATIAGETPTDRPAEQPVLEASNANLDPKRHVSPISLDPDGSWLAVLTASAGGQAAGWRVDGLSGQVQSRRGDEPFRPLTVGNMVPVGSDLRTGAASVIFLSRAGNRLVIQASTELRIAEPEPGGLLDHFIQSIGDVFYDVEPRESRSFGVNTPFLAAVVKGTRFQVSVAVGTSSVRVDEGRVLVESADHASSVMVEAGHVASAEPSRTRGLRLSGSTVPVHGATMAPAAMVAPTQELAPAENPVRNTDEDTATVDA